VSVSFYMYTTVAGQYSIALQGGSPAMSYVAAVTVAANTWTRVAWRVPGETSSTWETTTETGMTLSISLGTGATASTSTLSAWQTGTYGAAAGNVNFMASTSNVMYVTGLQLEAGGATTDYNCRPYATELTLCQRYYERVTSNGIYGILAPAYGDTGGQQATAMLTFLRKRTLPTFNYSALTNLWLRVSSTSNLTFTSLTAVNPTLSTVSITAATSASVATGTACAIVFSGAAGWIDLSAEL
jgi:hypothetical protein